MVTKKTLQINKNLHKPKISNLFDIIDLILYLAHHTNKGLVRVISYLAGIANTHKNVFPSVYTISRMCDLSETQVRRILRLGEQLGLWSINHRKDHSISTNKFGILSNQYILNPLFFDMNWRSSLQGIIPAFKYLPLVVLLITTSIIAKPHPLNLQSSSGREDGGIDLDYNSYIKKHKAYRAHAREEFAICTTYLKKENSQIRERLIMNDVGVQPSLKLWPTGLYDNTVFSETVRRAGKELMMSCAGMCSISSFNDMVLNVALKRLEAYSKTIQNPFGLFISICNQISKEMKIPVKHNKAYALASQFDIKLGKDVAVLEGGNIPREPSKEISHQREAKKLSTTANKFVAPTNKVSILPIEVLRSKNPSIVIVGIKQISTVIIEIQRHTDIEWRETTQEERDTWKMIDSKARESNPFLRGIVREPPTSSKGDPNFPAFKFYHIDQENILHDPESWKLGCKLCDKKIKIC